MMYWNKADFVKDVNKVLSVREDHKDLEYKKCTDGEYLILSSIIGHSWYFDITDYDEPRIFQTIATVVAGRVPHNIITDTATQMRIAKA